MMNTRKDVALPTIGFFSDGLEERYHTLILSGINDVARTHQANLLCFVGNTLNAPYPFQAQRNLVYDLANPTFLDGLIILGSIGNFITSEELYHFSQKYRPLPIVSLLRTIKGVPVIRVDNQSGLREIITHLIETHGHRRIAFIGGMPDNQDAQERYQVYVEVLSAHGLPVDPNLVVSGDFLPASGIAAMQRLLDERGVTFEAVVAANDFMAMGAMEVLRARGIRVPDEVAVVGFDDTDTADVANPPLTTVRQPIYEEGDLAARMVLDLINGKKVPPETILPSQPVIRRSCGCYFQNITTSVGLRTTSLPATTSRQKETIIANMVKAVSGSDMIDKRLALWCRQLFDTFQTDRRENFTTTAFLQTLDDILQQTTNIGGSPHIWQHALMVLRNHTLSDGPDAQTLSHITDRYHQACVLIGQMGRQWHNRRDPTKFWIWNVDRASYAIISSVDLEELTGAVATALLEIGVRQGYMVLFDNPQKPIGWARLIFAQNESGRIELGSNGKRFPTRQFLPSGLLSPEKPQSLLIEGLHSKKEVYGYVVFEFEPIDPLIYLILRVQISGALKQTRLTQERIRAEIELARSNQELEQFAYIASHDLQEPLRMVTSYLQLLQRRYSDKLDQDANEFIGFAVDGAVRMHTLIRDLLKYSRVGTQGRSFSPVDGNQILQQALANLSLSIEDEGAVITYDDLPAVIADDVQLIQVFQNLIANSIKFRQRDAPPKIHIGVNHQDDAWVFSVSDNGIGIEPEFLDRIFLVFRRLHGREEYEGTGIGLAICKRVIERHGGRIWVDSQAGQGSVFYFTLPDKSGGTLQVQSNI